jgi:hypothetical protein
MRGNWKLWAGVGAGLLVLLSAGTAAAASPAAIFGRYSYGGKSTRRGIDRDPENLLPGFAREIELLFKRMRARGFNPYLWEGLRTPQRAAELAAKGSGSKLSLHIYGGAVDIVNGDQVEKGGDPWKAPAAFWQALGEESKRLGLTWGGVWSSPDRPHVQGVTVSQQVAFRSGSEADRIRMVA